ncbi:MAG: trigger factor [Burkholderiales bacterium]|nr:trigger factor [Burkholderiales bacterium]
MQSTLENLGELSRRLNVAVPLAQIDGEVGKRLARLAKSVKVPGFRPGHVPLKMVEKQYGSQVRSDVISDAVQASFADAVREQNLRIAGYPRIEPAANPSAADGALEFSAVFEVYPDIVLGDIAAATIERPQVEVTPADVDRTLEVLRRQRATFHPAPDGAASGDRVKVDFTGTIDGVAFAGGQATDFDIVVGEGRMLPEFETAVTGMRPGEQKTFDLAFPADYHGKDVAGKTARFELTVKDVARPDIPPLDSAFATAFGIKSGEVDDLRTEVESNLQIELKRKIATLLRDQVMRVLRERATLVLPKSLVEGEVQQLMRRMAGQLQQQGVKAEDIKLEPTMFEKQAEDRVALGLILGEIVRNESLEAKPEQVKAMVRELAQTYEQPDAVVRWHYEKPERLADFENLAVEHNVVTWVLGKAQVKDVPASFEDVVGTPGRQ